MIYIPTFIHTCVETKTGVINLCLYFEHTVDFRIWNMDKICSLNVLFMEGIIRIVDNEDKK